MAWEKKRRTEEELREKVALIVQQRLSDPRLGFLTVTRVELSPDRKIAHVFYTVLGEPADKRKSARALADSAPRIREVLSDSMHMRYLPELRFAYDESVERTLRMHSLLDDLSKTHEPKKPEDA